MSSKTKYTNVYSGDTFRNLLMSYSCDRMDIDPAYRRDVRKAVAERRAARRAAKPEIKPVAKPEVRVAQRMVA
jgi:hypothetical protein